MIDLGVRSIYLLKPDFDLAAWRRERSSSVFVFVFLSGERSLRIRAEEWIAGFLPGREISELDRERIMNVLSVVKTGFPSLLFWLR